MSRAVASNFIFCWLGVGRCSFTENSAVTVQGGAVSP
ncbi:hypothetical protein EBT16_10870 [bacterium]|nr:hypothetical protein [bacterium]